MIERPPSFGLQLCFYSPLCHHASPGETCIQLSRVVLVSSPADAAWSKAGSEGTWDVEQDCSDCDCACFANDD